MLLLTPSNGFPNYLDQADLPVQKTWRLNERHYGGLTGLDKAETAAKHGEAQVYTEYSTYETSRFWTRLRGLTFLFRNSSFSL